MSRQPQLPPRCPFQKKSAPHEPLSSTSCNDINPYLRHRKSISQSFNLEDQPAWLDDLLSDTDSSFNGKSHRRAASDSLTLLDGLIELPSVNAAKDDDNPGSKGTCTGLESVCQYGPNSPRSKETLSFPDSALVSALSDYASQTPMQYIDADAFVSGFPQFNSVQDASGSAGDVNVEMKPVKRNSRQRSRVRKLQFIAELERTVDGFQNLGSELSVQVKSLLQQHVYLAMENKELRQQMVRLQQEKLVLDGQYLSLKEEVESLKLCLAYLPDSKVSTCFKANSATEKVHSEATWQMLDMGKLHIN